MSDPHQTLLIHMDDGRYAHMPNCNEQCDENGHWLQVAPTAPLHRQPEGATMNLPEYRMAIRSAQERFRDTIHEASEVLGKELAVADEQFFSDERRSVNVEDGDYAAVKRVRP